MIMAAAAMLTACSKSKLDNGDTGSFTLSSLMTDSRLNDIKISTNSLPSEIETDLSNFQVTVSNIVSEDYSKTYTYSDIKGSAIALPTGSYTVTAKSPEGQSAAWDQPLYSGSADFAVVAGAVSPVTVKCYLSNAVVSLNCTDTFISELSEYEIKISGDDGNFLTWTPDNISADGYFTTTSLKVVIDGKRSLDGSTASVSGTINNINARDHVILNIDAKVTGEVESLSIVVDGSVNDRNESFIVDGFEEIPIDPDPTPDPNPDPDPDPELPDAPYIVWEANPTFAVTELKADMSVELVVKAPGKIKTFLVNVNSETEAFQNTIKELGGGEASLDLIDNAELATALGALGLPTGDQLKGQTSVDFSLSSLVPMITGFDPAVGSKHVFTLVLTDESGQTLSQSLTFEYRGN